MRPGEPEALHRRLRFVDVYALAVGSVIGTGIFFLPGKAAAAMGPAALIPLVLGAVLAAMLALCYAEAASRFDGTGGAMQYAHVAFGEVVAFEVGWATWIARVVSWAALGNAFVTSLFPLWPGLDGEGAGPRATRLALLFALYAALTAVNLRGVGISGRVNTLLTAAKVAPLLVFVGAGLWFIDGDRFTPFDPVGYGALGSTTVMMLYAYVGFEGMVIPAAEMRDPRRVVPLALLAGIATIVVLYLGIWTVCTGTLPGLAGADNPVGDAAAEFLGAAGGTVIQLGIVASVIGINAFMALVTPRALYALAHARLLPPVLGAVNSRGVPAPAIWITSILAFALAWSGHFVELAVISVVARIAQYIPTCLAVLRLRRLADAPEARFAVPLGPVLPVLAIAVCVWLLTETEPRRVGWGAAGVGSGLLVYGVWRRVRPAE